MQVTVRFCSVPPQFRGRKPWGWLGASHLSSSSTNHTRGLAARRLFRVPQCAKALCIHKHLCLFRDSNPGPTAPQQESLTTIPVHYSATRELLVTDRVMSYHSQVTRTTLELAPLSPNFHATPTASTYLTCIAPFHRGSSAVLGSNSRHAGRESVTLAARLPRPLLSLKALNLNRFNTHQPLCTADLQ
ncbi:hypothetical protein TNCV_4421151 [Trichonephila clavipes]|nr:hypothetical protein TNCV_4421151 [Trichonephila clavipes]